MTVREHVSKTFRKSMLFVFLGLLGCIAIGFGGERLIGVHVSMPLGMLLFLASGIYGVSLLKCPKCTNWLFPVAGYVKRKMFFLARVDFCPYCGVSMDEEIDEHQEKI
ncbi:MAG: hypothetical protein VX988_03805 [Planctomycetota bacterium]|nr:hypothetical protein [Planctomycetota bacterium]